MAQLVSVLDCRFRGCGFESRQVRQIVNEQNFVETLRTALAGFEVQHDRQPDFIYVGLQGYRELAYVPLNVSRIFNVSDQNDSSKGVFGSLFGVPLRVAKKLKGHEYSLGVCEVCKHKFKCLVGYMKHIDLFEQISTEKKRW